MHVNVNSLKALILVRLQALLVVLNTLICKVSQTNLVLVFFCLFELVCSVRNCNLTVCAVNGVSGLRVLLFY